MSQELLLTKYSPKAFDELVARDKLLAPIINYIEKNKSITHLLFEGYQGTGKTTTANVIKNVLYGDEWRGHWFELNASKDNSVANVRKNVDEWASYSPHPLNDGTMVHNTIFLDECDHLSTEAQACLRRIIEDKSATCRFILSCNFKEKLLGPILSRCKVYHFDPLPDKAMFAYIKWIAEEEKIVSSDLITQLNLIVKAAKGDARAALNKLEDLQYGKSISEIKDNILSKSVADIITLSLTQDIDLLFQKLHEELIAIARTNKKDIGDAFVILAEHEYYSAMSRIKSLQFQTAALKIKKIV